MKEQKIIYYQDELNDEFSRAKITPRVIDENYCYIHRNPLWNFCSFVVQNILSMPIKVGYNKLKLHMKYIGKEKLKPYRKQGYFMYGNHTQVFADTFIPSVAMYPKRNFFIVNPENISMKGSGWIVEMLGAIPVPGNKQAMKKFLEVVNKRIKQGYAITIYPEAHIWPYYTKIRPFKAVAFEYPVKLKTPVFCFTNTYQKYGKKGDKVQIVSYIDGPFFSDETLTAREAKQKLRDEVYNCMVDRSKNSNIEVIKYKCDRKEERMLTLKDIKKDYQAGENVVHALKGINVEFRKSEFVSILGQSGGGKTTLLNIIGGLDRYTSGDLIINGKSTKEFKDRDWDAYRNYSVGFVFQNYNLIPHQTVLSNVELALTLSGVSKKERRERAIKALEEVGLKEQVYKKPNQLSGGQMQRVAIARAIVNNPEIILADEPTGALDTETSKQVMEILKEIAKDKLVIMVTHNPELAEQYSTRIIRISDGTMLDDTNPYHSEQEATSNKETRRTSMKFFTALNLSLNNLLTKKGRTLLTSFAGSIGIIGIALILAISTGMRNYIAKVEEDTLSSYPITIEEAVIDTSSMIEKMMSMEAEEKQREEGKIYSRNVMSEMMTTLSNKMENNNLTELKKYIEQEDNEIAKNSNSIKYNYNLELNLYKEDTKDGIVRVNPSTVMDSMGMGAMQEAQQNSPMAMMAGSSMNIMNTNVWTEMLDNKELLQSQYDMVEGKWPEKYNEVVLIVNSNYEIDDYTLYTLGLKSQEELTDRWEKAKKGEEIEEEPELSYTYEDLLNLSFKLVLNSDYYQKEKGLWIDKSEDTDYMKKKLKDCESIKVVGIIKQNKQSTAMAMDTGIGYVKELKEYVIEKTNEAKIVKEQKEKKDTNVFTGLKFPKEGEKKEFNFNDLTNEQKLAISQMSSEEIAKVMQTYTENQNATYENNLKTLGAIDLEKPASISIYPKNFESKEAISKAIEDYNQKQRDNGKDENVINYTDLVGTMMKSITQIIDAISFALIGFVSISLVVSSIMIGIITYISVLERTKEIGILRAIGASKRDISRVFNAETFIIGLIAGLMGVGITMLMTIPINSIILAATEVSIHTTLEPVHMAVLVLISLILTIIAGLIPAKVASKKDPVEALRTE